VKSLSLKWKNISKQNKIGELRIKNYTFGRQHFIIQLMPTTLKNIELLKHFKIKEAAATCFGLQGNHH